MAVANNSAAQWSLADAKSPAPAPAPVASPTKPPPVRVAVGKNADGTMRFYEYDVNDQAPKIASFVAHTTSSQYGANPNPSTHVELPPKRYLPENKKKAGPGNTNKLSQVNAVPAGASSNTAALQTQAALGFVGGTKGEARQRRAGGHSGPRTINGSMDELASFARVNPGYGINWKNHFKTDAQHNFQNYFNDPDYVVPPNDHPIKTGWRVSHTIKK